MRTIAIIGGGYSGLAAALHIARRAGGGCRAVVIDDADRPGLGVAYGTIRAEHLLNVRASRMSALHDEPDHLLRWLRARGLAYGANDFVPRAVFGAYLASLLDELRSAGRTIVARGRCVALSKGSEGCSLLLGNRETLRADAVVLALGNGAAAPIPVRRSKGGPAADPRVVQDPWKHLHADTIGRDARVVMVGAGLTAVDMVLTLDAIGHRGPITLISRRGLLPRGHGAPGLAARAPTVASRIVGLSPRAALRVVRGACEEEAEAGGDWRTVVDSLRPVTADAWAAWSLAQREAFSRHLRPFWDVHRHRMAPSVAARIESYIASGRLFLRCARVHAIESSEACVTVRATDTRADDGRADSLIDADLVLNCTGPSTNPARWNDALVDSLIGQGLARVDPLGLGLETDQDGRLVSDRGSGSCGLFALGPLRRPALWESIAVPEIRAQAAALAGVIVDG